MAPHTFDFALWASGFETGMSTKTASTSGTSGPEGQSGQKANISSKRIDSPKQLAKDNSRQSRTEHDMKADSFDTEPTATASTDGVEHEKVQIDGIPEEITGFVNNRVPTEVDSCMASCCNSEITGEDVPELETAYQFIESSECISQVDRHRLRDYWRNIVFKRSVLYGPKSIRTAEAVMDYAHAQFSCKEYTEAVKTYVAAIEAFRCLHGELSLSVALGLNELGVAIAASNTDLTLALNSLQESFDIRDQLLGPNHVDTIETLDNMARVRCSLEDYDAAYKTYLVVLRSREWLFGRLHPCVASTAWSIAGVLDHLHGTDSIEAQEYYMIAFEIYEMLDVALPDEVAAKFAYLSLHDHGTQEECTVSDVQVDLSKLVFYGKPERSVHSDTESSTHDFVDYSSIEIGERIEI